MACTATLSSTTVGVSKSHLVQRTRFPPALVLRRLLLKKLQRPSDRVRHSLASLIAQRWLHRTAGCAGADCKVQQLMDLILSSQDKTANFMNLMAADPTCGICVLTCVNTAPKDEDSQLACLTACSIPATTVRPFFLSRLIR